MINRRTFIAAAGAATAAAALPEIALAQTFDATPQVVDIKSTYVPGQLLVLPRSYYLYWVTEPGKAIRYGVSVGKAGLEFTGQAVIGAKKEWPTWRPTQEMIQRDPGTYGKFAGNNYVEPGGPNNPLGARALYLFQDGRDTYFRIHGTNAVNSIGRSASNGCIRMINDHVIDLYGRVPLGTQVTVL
ncbi:L,D-transpeptidase [Chachezhania sediminis]|uniref:L,D-transpeptidase n=1 Tax=Chachezhania sediminis TaxID=2599291 RepID=UPI0018EF2860|nr:L,D-transpeptidase [Chachezhania sediminis]